jgi:hypothetical protein
LRECVEAIESCRDQYVRQLAALGFVERVMTHEDVVRYVAEQRR